MTDLVMVLRRAARRAPGSAAERSLAAAAMLSRTSDYRDVPLGDPDPTLGLLRVGVAEVWCRRCGEVMANDGYCTRCGGRAGRPVTEFLPAGSFTVVR